jgi:hypothetical protein
LENSHSFSFWNFLFYIAINCVRLLTRLLPYIFEEPEWRGFFWSDIPIGQQQTGSNGVRISYNSKTKIFSLGSYRSMLVNHR